MVLILFLVILMVITSAILLLMRFNQQRINYVIQFKPNRFLIGIVAGIISIFTILWLFLLLQDEQISWIQVYGLFSQTQGIAEVGSPYTENDVIYLFISIIGAFFFTGLLISTITKFLDQHIAKVQSGEVRYRHLKNHYVIIGANEMLQPLIHSLLQEGRRSIVIVTSKSWSEMIRDIAISDDQLEPFIYYHRNLLSPSYSKAQTISQELCLDRCRKLFILGDKPSGQCDAQNTILVRNIYDSIQKMSPRKSQLDCIVYCNDRNHLLRLCKEWTTKQVFFIPFNLYDTFAEQLDGELYLSERMETLRSQAGPSHRPSMPMQQSYLILGLSPLTEAVVFKLATNLHYASSACRYPQSEIHIVTDDDTGWLRFKRSRPAIFRMPDIQVERHSCNIHDDKAQELILTLLDRWGSNLNVCVFSTSDADNYSLSHNLPHQLYLSDCRIFVQQRDFCNDDIGVTAGSDKGTSETLYRNIVYLGSFHQKANLWQESSIAVKMRESVQSEGSWRKFQYDNIKLRWIAHASGLYNLLGSTGMTLEYRPALSDVECTKKNEDTLAECSETIREILHRQYVAEAMLEGYIPTDHVNDPTHYAERRIASLHRYELVKDMEEVSNGTSILIAAIARWLGQEKFRIIHSTP